MSTQLTAPRFVLTVNGRDLGSWHKVSGLDVVFGTGADGRSINMKLPGSTKQPNIELTRPRGHDLEMHSWHELVILGDVAAARKSCTLTMYDTYGKPVARYHLESAWPSKVEIGGLTAGAAGHVLYETVTLTCEHIRRVA